VVKEVIILENPN